MKKIVETRIYVGRYQFGLYFADLYLDTKTRGGSFDCRVSPDLPAQIDVGGAGSWTDACVALLHEAVELALLEVGSRMTPDGVGAIGVDTYVFNADHAKFTEACNRAGLFMSQCLEPLRQAYERSKMRGKA